MSSSNNPLSSLGISSNTNGNGLGLGSKMQRSDAPEWMSYNPESEGQAKGDLGGEPQAFVDDIQAWKARMKEHERREKEKEMPNQSQRDSKQETKAPSRADSSSSWRSSTPLVQTADIPTDFKKQDDTKIASTMDKPLGRNLLSNEPIQDIDIFFTPGMDLTKPFETSSAFNKFFSQHAAMSTSETLVQQQPARKTDGSRFARFFTEDESDTPTGASQGLPGRQLSLDQLFQAHSPNSASAASPPLPPPLGRMPSEAEILESLKVHKPPAPVQPTENTEQSEDAFAFSKIMAALSKVTDPWQILNWMTHFRTK